MKLIQSLLFGILLGCLGNVCTAQQDVAAKASEKFHVLLPAPPLNYFVSREASFMGKKFLGFNTILQTEGKIGKVVVKVDLREDADFSNRGFRSGGVKGYLNGFAEAVGRQGYKMKTNKLPNLENNDLTDWLYAEIEFENSEGKRLLVKKRIFFDSRGFDIMVVAEDEEELELLSRWADKIQLTDETK